MMHLSVYNGLHFLNGSRNLECNFNEDIQILSQNQSKTDTLAFSNPNSPFVEELFIAEGEYTISGNTFACSNMQYDILFNEETLFGPPKMVQNVVIFLLPHPFLASMPKPVKLKLKGPVFHI